MIAGDVSMSPSLGPAKKSAWTKNPSASELPDRSIKDAVY
jgi:hypothetical protein